MWSNGVRLKTQAQGLADAHEALDAAVAAAYGCSADVSGDQVLRELLPLNGGERVRKSRCGAVRRRLRWRRGFPFAMWEASREPWAED